MSEKHDFQSFDEAVAEEQAARIAAYLNRPEIVCGQPLVNITPRIWMVLIGDGSPFIVGGNSIAIEHVAQFLVICHQEDTTADLIVRMLAVASDLPLEESFEEISRFIDLNFMDSPRGKAGRQIASPIAWIRYRFRCEPFRMDLDEIMDTPLRILYQEMRCWETEHGVDVRNRSDAHTRNWLAKVNEAMKDGSITKEDLDAFNARIRAEAKAREN